MREKYSLLSVKILLFGIVAIMLITPFYTPVYVWAVSNFHHFSLFRVWKELVLIGLLVAVVVFALSHRSIIKHFFKNPAFIIGVVYIAYIFVIAIIDLITGRVSYKGVLQGLILDLRLPGFFLMAMLVSYIALERGLPRLRMLRIAVYPAAVVIAFGLLQMFILPRDILTHFGYGQDTVVPYQLVDKNPDFVRVQSTLPGPNPLGAYLLVIISLAAATILTMRKKPVSLLILVGVAAVVLFGSYSRSAEIGTIIALGTLLVISKKKAISRHTIAVSAIILITLLSIGLFALRDNDFVQNTIFHTSEDSSSPRSSNTERAGAIKAGVRDIIGHPLGGGVGSAGPASRRNLNGPAKISENYFIQLGQELGVIGLGLFITVLVLIVRELWRMRDQPLAKGLIAGLAGLTFVNMVSHAWTDDTLAYLWWGLAGIALAPVILAGSKLKAK